MRVNLRELREMQDYISAINDADLHDIEWHVDGEPVVPSEELVDEWRFSGLCNTYFAAWHLMKGHNDTECS